MDSQLAINTIKESCYRVGYPTHDAEQERRELINQSCDYAIECIEKLGEKCEEKLKKIEQILKVRSFTDDVGNACYLDDSERIRQIREVLEQE